MTPPIDWPLSEDEKKAWQEKLEKRIALSRSGELMLALAKEADYKIDFGKNLETDSFFSFQEKRIVINTVFSEEEIFLAFVRNLRRAEQNENVAKANIRAEENNSEIFAVDVEKDAPKSYLMKKVLLEGDRRVAQTIVAWELAGNGDDSVWQTVNADLKKGFTNNVKFGSPDNPFPEIFSNEISDILSGTLKAYIDSYEKSLGDRQYLELLEKSFINEKLRRDSFETLQKIEHFSPPFNEDSSEYAEHLKWIEELKVNAVPYYSQYFPAEEAINLICCTGSEGECYWNEEPEDFVKRVFASVSKETRKSIAEHFKRIKKAHGIKMPDIKGLSSDATDFSESGTEILIATPEIVIPVKPEIVIISDDNGEEE